MNASSTGKKHASACSNTSKPFTIPSACTRHSDTCHLTNSKPFTPRLLRRNHLPRRYPKVLGYRSAIPLSSQREQHGERQLLGRFQNHAASAPECDLIVP